MNKLSVMLISVLLISCNKLPLGAPKPPVIPNCAILKDNYGNYFMNCLNSNDSTIEWDLTIPQAHGYLCTSQNGYMKSEKYAQDLLAWYHNNCKK